MFPDSGQAQAGAGGPQPRFDARQEGGRAGGDETPLHRCRNKQGEGQHRPDAGRAEGAHGSGGGEQRRARAGHGATPRGMSAPRRRGPKRRGAAALERGDGG